MVWAAGVSDDVVRAAWPVPSRLAAPRVVVPSVNVTAPVGVPAPGATGATEAVTVTG